MAGVTSTLDVLGQERVSKALNRLLRASANPDDALRDMGEYLLNAHRQRWAQQQAPDGTPWEPLSEQYAARKRAKRPAAGILVFDDVLRGTLRYQISGHTLALGNRPPLRRHTPIRARLRPRRTYSRPALVGNIQAR